MQKVTNITDKLKDKLDKSRSIDDRLVDLVRRLKRMNCTEKVILHTSTLLAESYISEQPIKTIEHVPAK